MLKQYKTLLLFLLIFIGLSFAYSQDDLPAKPALETSVYDYANILSSVQKSIMTQLLHK